MTEKLRNMRSSQVSKIKDTIFDVFREIPPININEKPSTIASWKKNPDVESCFNKLYNLIDPNNEESDTFMTLIIKKVWPKKSNLSNLHLAWAASVVEIVLDPNNPHLKLSESIVRPILEKNLVSINN